MLFQLPSLSAQELDVIARIDEVRAETRLALAPARRWLGPLRRTTFARNIQASNSIEGHNVSLDDALAAAAANGQPLDADSEDWLAVKHYGDAMTYIVSLADDPHFTYSGDLLRSLHFMMMKQDLGVHPGRWRDGPVYVWSTSEARSVYDGPPARDVADLVAELVSWLNAGDADQPAIARGAMAHLNLAMVHPFKDGNGRMARALHTLVMARESITAPEFASIEEYLGRNTPEYYSLLASAGDGRWSPDRDARPWMQFVLVAHYFQALTVRRRVADAERTWEALTNTVDRLGLNERALTTLYQASIGNTVRRADHVESSETSERVASNDLKQLVDAGLLTAIGEKRGRRYVASEELASLRRSVLSTRGTITNPFD